MTTSNAYQVDHVTRYVYSTPVATSQHAAYLRPRELPRQQVEGHVLDVEPVPANHVTRTDYFGNTVDHFQLLKPHSALVVSSRSRVRVEAAGPVLSIEASPCWEDVRLTVSRDARLFPAEVAQFVSASPYVPLSPELETLARRSFATGRPLLACALALMADLHERFAFDTSATSVTTPLTLVLDHERGVCQDFAHVAIGCFRSLGLAARYVSGYLLTDPPPGQPRLVGADASHAWVSFYCPAHGWVDLDPTNGVVVAGRHITVAWGRDYGDVSPLRGVLLGGAEHALHVGVSVLPLELRSP